MDCLCQLKISLSFLMVFDALIIHTIISLALPTLTMQYYENAELINKVRVLELNFNEPTAKVLNLKLSYTVKTKLYFINIKIKYIIS